MPDRRPRRLRARRPVHAPRHPTHRAPTRGNVIRRLNELRPPAAAVPTPSRRIASRRRADHVARPSPDGRRAARVFANSTPDAPSPRPAGSDTIDSRPRPGSPALSRLSAPGRPRRRRGNRRRPIHHRYRRPSRRCPGDNPLPLADPESVRLRTVRHCGDFPPARRASTKSASAL
jgi:hypothetical protein